MNILEELAERSSAIDDWPYYSLTDNIVPKLAECIANGEDVVIGTLIGARGSVPRKNGAQMLLCDNPVLCANILPIRDMTERAIQTMLLALSAVNNPRQTGNRKRCNPGVGAVKVN